MAATNSERVMYEVTTNGRPRLESDACGIGFLATRKGIAERRLIDAALEITQQFDHRGAPGHGAGIQLDIPWSLLLDRFSAHAKLIAQRDVALGMFFLPFDSDLRTRCVEAVEWLASLAGAEVLQWSDVPVDPSVLSPETGALRTLPIVRQALFRRPSGMSDQGWFACRYLLRLALDHDLREFAGDSFGVVSLSNRTVVYKGLAELSKVSKFYPDLEDPQLASRYVLFHSRYCTNTTTAWRRAQPFWSIAHNGEIATIGGNVAWMNAIGKDLVFNLVEKYPQLSSIAEHVDTVVCSGGSDTANLDDMMIALLAGGLSFSQAMLGLLPGASAFLPEDDPLRGFYRAASVYLGACDGPAAIVGCDGDLAVAHLDRNGLRPLWVQTTHDYVLAASELTGVEDLGDVEDQIVMGPGEIMAVDLRTGKVIFDDEARSMVAREPFPSPEGRTNAGQDTLATFDIEPQELAQVQAAFGMHREDLEVLLAPLAETGKPAIGAMGDDTSPAALLDEHPRRLEDYFALRFAQETSPPVDPLRDHWVFDTTVALGDRAGLWSLPQGPLVTFEHRVLSFGQAAWLESQPSTKKVSLLFPAAEGLAGMEAKLDALIQELVDAATPGTIFILSDRSPTRELAPLPALRLVSRLHHALSASGRRSRVGIVADVGIWDIHQCALFVTLGADAVCPWLGIASVGACEANYLKGVRAGFLEVMSMMGVTPASAYCGARLVEAIGLDRHFMAREFPGVPVHLGGIGPEVLGSELLSFHDQAFSESREELLDVAEFRHSKEGRRHYNNAEVVRSLQGASGYAKKIHSSQPGSKEAYEDYSALVQAREPITLLDCLSVRQGQPIDIDEVEPEEAILWRFMAPGMSEGALSEPAHRTVARAFNVLRRYCSIKAPDRLPPGIGPIANSGEGGFDKSRIGTRDANRSIQYAGARFTITPMTAATAMEAEVKFAQGAKPGKGGQLPGKKVTAKVARQRGCEPGYELVSPPINHNLYSIEDVKLMLESWRHLNPDVSCALKFVATYGIEMVCVGGVNAGANRLHISDGCGGTGAAKRVDQKHAGVPVAAVLPRVQDMLVEEGLRHLVEISADGGVQTGKQALKLFLLGADKVGFGTSLLIAIGCSMLRKCHLSGPDPTDASGKRRLGCTPGIATQDPHWIARFAGDSKHICRMLIFAAREIREELARMGVRSVAEIVGRRDLLERRPRLGGKAAKIDFSRALLAPHGSVSRRDYLQQTKRHMPARSKEESLAAHRAQHGSDVLLRRTLTNEARCVGVVAAGEIARACGDLGLAEGLLRFEHSGAAGHFYAAYAVAGMSFRMTGPIADSCFTAAYGGELVVIPPAAQEGIALVGNAFGYGARGGRAYIAGRAGNRFGICLRKNYDGGGARLVVEGVAANAFQYMTGGVALVLGPTGPNLGSGMTGGCVYLLDCRRENLNRDYVGEEPLSDRDAEEVITMLKEHREQTGSPIARELLLDFPRDRFRRISTIRKPELTEPQAQMPELVEVK